MPLRKPRPPDVTASTNKHLAAQHEQRVRINPIMHDAKATNVDTNAKALTATQDIQSLLGLADAGFLTEAKEITSALVQQQGGGFTQNHAGVVAAHIHKLKGRLYEARTEYRQAAETLHKERDSGLLWFIKYEIAHIDQMLGAYIKSRDQYCECCSTQGVPAEIVQLATMRLAEVAMIEGQFVEANRLAQKAISLTDNFMFHLEGQRIIGQVYHANIMFAKANITHAAIFSNRQYKHYPLPYERNRLDLAEASWSVAPIPAQIWAHHAALSARRTGNSLQAAKAQSVLAMTHLMRGKGGTTEMLEKAAATYASAGYGFGEKSVVALQCLAAWAKGKDEATKQYLSQLEVMTEATGAYRYLASMCRMITTGKANDEYEWLMPETLPHRINQLRENLRQPCAETDTKRARSAA